MTNTQQMNFLKLLTKPTDEFGTFNVFWTNSDQGPRGYVKVHVPHHYEDPEICAELYTLQYLLEVAEVVGADLAGNANTKFIVTYGAIKKLARKSSGKAHLVNFAKFLTTRFSGCPIEVEKKEDWFADRELECTFELTADKPLEETMHLHGLGLVHITSHVVERLAERLSESKEVAVTLGEAWRMLRNLGRQECVIEIEKNSARTKLRYAAKGREEGRYFFHPGKRWIFVVTNGKLGQTLVTAYPISLEFASSLK